MIALSDLHLPPARTDVSARSCQTLARQLAAEQAGLIVVLAGDMIELLGSPALREAVRERLAKSLAVYGGRG